MAQTAGFEIVRVADIPWEDRRNVDNWPSRAGMYCDDKPNQLCIRLTLSFDSAGATAVDKRCVRQ